MRSYQIMIDAAASLGADLRDRYHIDQMCLCQSFGKRTCVSFSPLCPFAEERGGLFAEARLEKMLYQSFSRYAKEDIDVLYLATSSALLAVYEKAKTVAENVMKHFPGYGNNTDTHVAAAVDDRSLSDLESVDLVPFQGGIDAGCGVDAPGSFMAFLSQNTQVHAMVMPGKRYDIGNLESYKQACENYRGIVEE